MNSRSLCFSSYGFFESLHEHWAPHMFLHRISHAIEEQGDIKITRWLYFIKLMLLACFVIGYSKEQCLSDFLQACFSHGILAGIKRKCKISGRSEKCNLSRRLSYEKGISKKSPPALALPTTKKTAFGISGFA